MKRALLPLAMLASACDAETWGLHPALPSSPEPVPPPSGAATPSAAVVLAQWSLPPNDPWAPYQKLTLASALDQVPQGTLPDIFSLDIVRRAEESARQIQSVPTDVMFVVDLRGAASVAFGAELSRVLAQPISLVMTFNNWPAEAQVIPAEETLAALATDVPRRIDASNAPGVHSVPVFLLDAWRLEYRDETIDDNTTDNRYFLNEGDLPSATVLREAGIRRIVYVVDDMRSGRTEEDDLNAPFAKYEEAGVSISMLDLSWFTERALAQSWTEQIAPFDIYVSPRPTILIDPRFYGRSRGGFGGTHIRPSGGWGHSGGWGGHGFGGHGFGGHGGG